MIRWRIAINAFSALQGGGQTYLLNLLPYAKDFSDMKIYIFSPPQFAKLYAFPGIEVIPCSMPATSILHRIFWEKRELPKLLRKLKIDLVYCAGGIITFSPPPDCLTAVAFRNLLIFDTDNRRKYPLGYKRFRLAVLEKISKKSFKKADLLICLSEHGKKIIDSKVPDRKSSSVVIPHGLDNKFRTAQSSDLARPDLLPDEEYLLYVSIIDAYKAQIEVVRAYHILRQKRPTKEKLLLLGPSINPKYDKLLRSEIRRLNLENEIILTGQIHYSTMPSIYRHAKAHIFASTCETFGIAVLECLGSGRPLFLSNRSPMVELAGDGAVYFDPCKPQELAALLLRYLDDERWTEKIRQKAYERSFLYNWETTARKTFQAMLKLRTGVSG